MKIDVEADDGTIHNLDVPDEARVSRLGASPCSLIGSDAEEGLREAWQIINVLHMQVLDEDGEGWKRALDWLHEWENFRANVSEMPPEGSESSSCSPK